MKIGYCTWSMPTVPIDTIVRFVAETGYDSLEPTVTPGYSIELYSMDAAERKRVKRLIQDSGLEIPAISGHASLVERDPEVHEQNFKRLRDSVDLCVEWTLGDRPPALDTTAGGTPGEWEAVKPLVVDRVGALVEYGAAHGVVIAMAPHYRSCITRPEQMLELLDLVKSPYLRVNFDISHFLLYGYGITESVEMMASVTEHAHIRDVRGQVPDFEFLIPGEGDIDYVLYLREMQRMGYTGHITAEISLMVQERPNYDALVAMKQTYAVMARAFDEAGVRRS
ncbi:MAG: sugar phosphate isomerase/epimerase [Caldilineaceae bacterium]|nr:sugar phosphate isomerase/epimerase [Caldilineaceae bacterium]